MSKESILFSMLIQCGRCGNATPINGMNTSLLCSNCAQVIPIVEGHWLRLIGDTLREDLRAKKGEVDETRVMAPWGEFAVQHGHAGPFCPQCKEELPAVFERAGDFPCPACGEAVSVRKPPDWFVQVNPGARWLVGETCETEAAEQKEREPISIHCINCGGNLNISGDSRTIRCKYCDSKNMLPDQLWLRLHPAAVRQPWFIIMDTGPAGYSLPEDIEDFCDVAFAPDGGFIAAFIEEMEYDEDDDDDEDDEDDGPIRSRVVKFDPQGMVQWVRDDIRFDEYAKLLCSPDGSRLLVTLPRASGFIRLDPVSGASLGQVLCPPKDEDAGKLSPEAPRPLLLDNNSEGMALGPDGTLVILRFGDEDDFPTFTRYDLEGQPLPMWPEAMPERILLPPLNSHFCISPGGDLIIVEEDFTRYAHYDREGNLVSEKPIATPENLMNKCGLGADELENLYLAYMPEDYWQSGGGTHILRVPLGGEAEIFRGWTVDPNNPLGDTDPQFKVRADGTLYLGSGLDNLRVVSAEGEIVFRPAATVEMDDITVARYREHQSE